MGDAGRKEEKGDNSLRWEMEEGGSIYYTKIEVGGRREKKGNSGQRSGRKRKEEGKKVRRWEGEGLGR